MALQHLRSGTAHKRPIPAAMSAGQIAINTNETSPGLFFKNSNGDLVKVGPVHIGTTAPNANPASTAATALVSGTVYQILTVGTTDFTTVGAGSNTVGHVFTATGAGTGTGTVSGQQGVEKGEQWLDTTGGKYVLKIYDGSAWRSESGTFVDSSGDTMTGALLLDNAASASAPDLSFDGDPNTGIYSPGADKLAISTGGAQRLVVDAGGDVGIGTDAPLEKFHINAGSSGVTSAIGGVDGAVISTGAGRTGGLIFFTPNDRSAGIFFGDPEDNNRASYKYDHASNATIISSNNAECLRITSSGNVGIGESGPLGKLVVNSDENTATFLAKGETNNPGYPAYGFSGQNLDNGTRGAGMYLPADGTLAFSTNAAERLRIASNGNVGIGTPSPTDKLNISSGSNQIGLDTGDQALYGTLDVGHFANGAFIGTRAGTNSGSNVLRLGTTGLEKMRIASNGSVGIGTSSPGEKLEVDGHVKINTSAGPAALFLAQAGTTNGRVAAAGGGGTDLIAEGGRFLSLGSVNGTIFNYITAVAGTATERMRIAPNGNVGIGTSSPDATLHINDGDISQTWANHSADILKIEGAVKGINITTSTTGFIAFSDAAARGRGVIEYLHASDSMQFDTAGAEKMRIASNGSVGIGTSNPSEKLHVSGNILSSICKTIGSYTNLTPLQLDRGVSGSGMHVNLTSGRYELEATDKPLVFNAGYSTGAIEFNINGSQKMRIIDNGNVGIGTSNPGSLLHINKNTNNFIKLSTGTSAINTEQGILNYGRLVNGVTPSFPGQLTSYIKEIRNGSSSEFSLHFGTTNSSTADATNKMIVRYDGNVGIGNDSPNNLLSLAASEPRIEIKDTDTNARFLIDCNSSAGSVNFRVDQDGSAANSAAIFTIDNSEKMRVTHNDRLLLGTSASRSVGAPTGALEVEGEEGNEASLSISRFNNGAGGAYITLGKARGTKAAPAAVQPNDNTGFIEFAAYDGGDLRSVCAGIHAYIEGTPGANDVPGRLSFRTTADGSNAPTERMRIASNGDIKLALGNFASTVLINQNASSGDGVYIDEDGGIKLQVSRWNGTVAGFNRMNNDGNIITFFGQGTNEGSIVVSGTTVSLTGGHLSRWSQLESNAERTEILRGSVLSNLDEMCEWGEEDNEQLNRMKVSDVEGDPNVAGVFQGWDDDDETYLNDFHCAMTGDFIIRIAQGTTVARGDLLMSAGDGTAKPQGDDIVRSKTIAKVTSTTVSTTYADGSYCVPCVLMAC